MKLGTENSKKTMVAVGLSVVALFLVIRMFDFGSSTPVTATNTKSAPPTTAPRRPSTARRGHAASKTAVASGPVTTSLDPRLRLNELNLTENTEYTGKGRNIFLAQAEDVVIPRPVAPGLKNGQAKVTPPQPYVPPPPPPIELKFFGFASSQGVKRVFLSKGDDVFVASEGDIVNRRYKIVKINANNIEVLDVLNNNQQTIPLSTS